jgi:hypothetical protein
MAAAVDVAREGKRRTEAAEEASRRESEGWRGGSRKEGKQEEEGEGEGRKERQRDKEREK